MNFFTVQYTPSGDARFPIRRERIPVAELTSAEHQAVLRLVNDYIAKQAAHIAAGGRSRHNDPLYNLRQAVCMREHLIDRAPDVEPGALDWFRWLMTTATGDVREALQRVNMAAANALSKYYEQFDDSPAHTNKIQACEWRTGRLA